MELQEMIAAAKECTDSDLIPILQALNERLPGRLEGAVLQVVAAPDMAELPQAVQVGKFLRDIGTPPPMLIERLVPDHSLILVTGKPKHAKSYLALDLLDTTALGKHALSALALSQRGPVLYLSMEDGPYETANRLLKRGMKPDDPRHIHICAGRLNLAQPAHLRHIRAMLGEINPVLLCIDTAREGCGIRDWTDPTEVADKLRPIRSIARDCCSVILVAHNRKAAGEDGDEISGTNAVASSVDGWISVRRKEVQQNGNLRLFANIDGRAGMRGEIVIEMDTDNLHFRLLTEEELAAAKRQERDNEQERRKQAIRDAITTGGGRATYMDIADRTGLGYESIKPIVRSMLDGGELIRDGERTPPGGGRPSPLFAISFGKTTDIPIERTNLPKLNPPSPCRDPSESRRADDEERDV